MSTWKNLCEIYQYVVAEPPPPENPPVSASGIGEKGLSTVTHTDCQWVCSCWLSPARRGKSRPKRPQNVGALSLHVDKNGLLWVPIPKCGTQSIREHTDQFKERINVLDVPNFKKGFVVLRDPIDRFKSLVSMYFLKGSSHNDSVRKYRGYGKRHMGLHNASNVVDIVLRRFPKLRRLKGANHWLTQKSFIPETFYELEDPRFYDMEWLRKNYEVHNTSPSDTVLVSESQREIILKIYAEDVELYERYIGPIAPHSTSDT